MSPPTRWAGLMSVVGAVAAARTGPGRSGACTERRYFPLGWPRAAAACLPTLQSGQPSGGCKKRLLLPPSTCPLSQSGHSRKLGPAPAPPRGRAPVNGRRRARPLRLSRQGGKPGPMRLPCLLPPGGVDSAQCPEREREHEHEHAAPRPALLILSVAARERRWEQPVLLLARTLLVFRAVSQRGARASERKSRLRCTNSGCCHFSPRPSFLLVVREGGKEQLGLLPNSHVPSASLSLR